MTWTLTLPWTRPPLSLNDQMHWAKKGRITKDVRTVARVLARNARIPAQDRITVQLHYQPATKRRRDGDNLTATVKPCVDGITDAGVVVDDDSTHVTHLPTVIHDPVPGQRAGALWLVITPVEEQP
jgi:crossover junction endodeoxyribonuclease RusA